MTGLSAAALLLLPAGASAAAKAPPLVGPGRPVLRRIIASRALDARRVGTVILPVSEAVKQLVERTAIAGGDGDAAAGRRVELAMLGGRPVQPVAAEAFAPQGGGGSSERYFGFPAGHDSIAAAARAYARPRPPANPAAAPAPRPSRRRLLETLAAWLRRRTRR